MTNTKDNTNIIDISAMATRVAELGQELEALRTLQEKTAQRLAALADAAQVAVLDHDEVRATYGVSSVTELLGIIEERGLLPDLRQSAQRRQQSVHIPFPERSKQVD